MLQPAPKQPAEILRFPVRQGGPPSGARPRPALFRALGRHEPPRRITVDEESFGRRRVVKHDSWAATAIYDGASGPIICKFNRLQPILGLPMRWLGRWLARREAKMYRRLADSPYVPAPLGEVFAGDARLEHAVAHRFVPGHPLGHDEMVNDDFFPQLEAALQSIHEQQAAYVDLHKRENIIVGDDGRPYLIDFQISFALPSYGLGRTRLMRCILSLLQKSDTYHLNKHYARLRPDQCGYTLDEFHRRRPWYINAHRVIAVPLRTLRRRLLVMLGVRKRRGRVETEQFQEEGLRPADSLDVIPLSSASSDAMSVGSGAEKSSSSPLAGCESRKRAA